LLEEERRFAGRVGTALDRMGGIIAPDAIDAADLKYLGLADDRNRRRRQRKKRLRSGLCFGRGALCSRPRQRQRTGCQNGPAIDGIHERSPCLRVFFRRCVYILFPQTEYSSALLLRCNERGPRRPTRK